MTINTLWNSTWQHLSLIRYLPFSNIQATNLLHYEMFYFVIILHASQHIFRETNDLSENYLSWEFKNLSPDEYGLDIASFAEEPCYFLLKYFSKLVSLCYLQVSSLNKPPSGFLLPEPWGLRDTQRHPGLPYRTCWGVEPLWSGSWNLRRTSPGSPLKC